MNTTSPNIHLYAITCNVVFIQAPSSRKLHIERFEVALTDSYDIWLLPLSVICFYLSPIQLVVQPWNHFILFIFFYSNQ